ncbi:unnamed protein product [Haemonchus placei]|uniref:HTH_Tnp_Tc3_1 domain-containing protein n=1 Tax=Haemonchus placei TaxID=6290 RepID=A0A158QMM3_HAEPC|nr:unnamed protein product [Haemonchus placei]
MPKGRRLSSTDQSQILLLRQAGHSNKAIAEQLGRSRRCIDDFVKNPATYGQAHGGGRPLKLTRADHRRMARMASKSAMSANQIRARLSLNVSTSTVLRAIRRQIILWWERMKSAPRSRKGGPDNFAAIGDDRLNLLQPPSVPHKGLLKADCF